MKSKLSKGELDCAALAPQPVIAEFKDGKLKSMYFVWDRDRIKNLVHDLDEHSVRDIEEAELNSPSRFKDEMWISKSKIEDEMIAEDAYEGAG